ncbi:copper homeostasis protein CutC [Rickettsiales bacterium LUAb2]
MLILEAAIDNINDAIKAVNKGSNRLEVCSDLENDGLTPSYELFKECLKLNVPCFAMIRVQKGEFTVNNSTYNIMQQQIIKFKELGANGIVLGILDKQNQIDIDKIKKLVSLANPIPVTFHKAIDRTKDIFLAVEQLIEIGVKRILTSGGKKTVIEGISIIQAIHNKFGNKIIIVAGGSLNFNNLDEIKLQLPFCEYHGRKIVES